MHTFHCWRVRSIAFLAVAFFTFMHLAYSAEPLSEAGAKSAPAAAGGILTPDPVPPRAAEKPAAEKPAAEKPAAEKPAAEKPAAEKPAAEKPAAEKPAAEKPAAEKPAAEKPAKPADSAKPAPSGKPPAKEASDGSSRSGGTRPSAEKPAAPAGGQESTLSTTGGTAASGSKVEKPSAETPKKAVKLRFQFKFAPWREVIEWFAQQAGYSLIVPSTVPQGTFNYSSTREYSSGEALDLINTLLQYNKFVLVPHGDILMLVPIEDLPLLIRSWAPEKKVEALDSLGESQIVTVFFPLRRGPPRGRSSLKSAACLDRRDW